MKVRLILKIVLVLVVALATATAFAAGPQIEIKGDTYGSSFGNGNDTWHHLTFNGAGFDIKPGDFTNGSATIQNLGTFSLGNGTADYTGSFNLKINFTTPTGWTEGDQNWAAILSGDVQGNTDHGVKLSFTEWSDTFAYTNALGSGQFTLTLGGSDSNGTPQEVNGKLVYDLCEAQLTGKITNASFTTVTTESTVPEPSAVVLLGTVLLGVVGLVRRKMA